MERTRLSTGTTRALVDINCTWLNQALDLLETLDDQSFQHSPPGFAPQRVGGHLRHILEFYECFLEGLAKGHVNYDARRRELILERSRAAAAGRIQHIREQLVENARLRTDGTLQVSMEDAESGDGAQSLLTSSISRELQGLSSHTIHHFALIAMTMRAHGLAVDPAFGMSPATLRFQKRKLEESSEAA